jgi:hypothetical protein
MPVTRSEALFFAAGVAAGAALRGAYPKLKEKYGPVMTDALAAARTAVGDACAEAARAVDRIKDARGVASDTDYTTT